MSTCLAIRICGSLVVAAVLAGCGSATSSQRASPTDAGQLVTPTANAIATSTSTPIRTAAESPGQFTPTGSMGTKRETHTATLLVDGRVLIAGGWDLASAELYGPSLGKFTRTGSMATKRWNHAATLLPDGRVLVSGGWAEVGALPSASAELYDPKTAKFTLTGSMATRRVQHTASPLADGRILVAGGSNGTTALASAELYDPKTGKFTLTGSMATKRMGHTATSLSDGRVLIAGGGGPTGILASAELYDPKTGRFSPAGSMAFVRWCATATLLIDGRILVAGGYDSIYRGGPSSNSAELYDPETSSFSSTGSMAYGRTYHTATPLPDGRVLIAGGEAKENGSSSLASAELYDPMTGAFNPGGAMADMRSDHTATLLSDGRVLVAGGYDGTIAPWLASAELYSVSSATPSPTSALSLTPSVPAQE